LLFSFLNFSSCNDLEITYLVPILSVITFKFLSLEIINYLTSQHDSLAFILMELVVSPWWLTVRGICWSLSFSCGDFYYFFLIF
jgi:hypothetical protein